jgi:AcrR family transcriptional regulator
MDRQVCLLVASDQMAAISDVPVRRSAREQILDTAYELFTQRGIRAVGVDEVIARSGVAKATLYKHFRSKNELALAFLQRREQRWTIDFLEAGSARLADDPEDQLLAMFDVLDEWFRKHDSFNECSFISVLLEMGSNHPVGQACVRYLANVRAIIARRATNAGLADPDEFAKSFHILIKGAIISASEGDPKAAQRAQDMARVLIEQHRPYAPVQSTMPVAPVMPVAITGYIAGMASTKQRNAARRNITKAQAGARSKRSIANMPKATRTALGKEAAAVAQRQRTGRSTPKTRAELYEMAKRRDLPGRSKMGRDELARALHQQ